MLKRINLKKELYLGIIIFASFIPILFNSINTNADTIRYWPHEHRDEEALNDALSSISGTRDQIQFSQRVDAHPELFDYSINDNDTSWNRGDWAYDETWTIPKLNDYKNKSAEDTIKQGTSTNSAGIIIKGDIHDAAIRSYNHFHKNKLHYNDTLSGDGEIISDKQAVIDFYRADADLMYKYRHSGVTFFYDDQTVKGLIHAIKLNQTNDDPRVFYPWEETMSPVSYKQCYYMNKPKPKNVKLSYILMLYKHGFNNKQIAKKVDLSISEIKDDVLNTKYEKGSPISDSVFPAEAYRPKG